MVGSRAPVSFGTPLKQETECGLGKTKQGAYFKAIPEAMILNNKKQMKKIKFCEVHLRGKRKYAPRNILPPPFSLCLQLPQMLPVPNFLLFRSFYASDTEI